MVSITLADTKRCPQMHDFDSLYRLLGENSDTVTISARKASLDLVRPRELPLGIGLVVGSDWVQLTRISLSPIQTQRQILALTNLPAGWLNGESSQYTKADLAKLALSIEPAFLAAPGLRAPSVVPFVDNTVILEWSRADTCVEVVENFDTGLYEFYATDFALDVFEEHTFNRLEDALQRVVEFQAAAMMPRAKAVAVLSDLAQQDLAVVHKGVEKKVYLRVGDEWRLQ